jgi:hypothetical protein
MPINCSGPHGRSIKWEVVVRKALIIASSLLLSLALNAETADLYGNMPILDYSYMDLNLSSVFPNTLYISEGYINIFSQNLGTFNYFSQTRDMHFVINDYLSTSFNYTDSLLSGTSLTYGFFNHFFVDLKYYFYDLLPIPLSVDIFPNVMGSFHNEAQPSFLFSVTQFLGIGLGRIINIAPVTKAVKLCDELGVERNSGLIARLAEIIGKRYEYDDLYRENSEKVFYKDLKEALGGSYDPFDIKRILEQAGTVAVSETGFELSLRASIGYDSGLQSSNEKKILLMAIAAIPLDTIIQMRGEGSVTFDFDSMVFTPLTLDLFFQYQPLNPFLITLSSYYWYYWKDSAYDNQFGLKAGLVVFFNNFISVDLTGEATFGINENKNDLLFNLEFQWNIF